MNDLLNLVFTITGLWLSYTFNLTSCAAIILVASVVFFAVQVHWRIRTGQAKRTSPGQGR